MAAAFEKWWDDVQPMLVNEGVKGPKYNPFKELYWKQFGVEPTEADLKAMEVTK